MSALTPDQQHTIAEWAAHEAMVKARDAYDGAVLDRLRTVKRLDEYVAKAAEQYRAAKAHFEALSSQTTTDPTTQPTNPSGGRPDETPAPACSCHLGSVCGEGCAKGRHHGGCWQNPGELSLQAIKVIKRELGR